MPKVRTTMQPDVDLDVSDIEAADLEAQGLLVKASTKATGPSVEKGA